MKIKLHRANLRLHNEFAIAHGSQTHAHSLIVELSSDGQSGFGEAVCHHYYGHNYESLTRSCEQARATIEQSDPDSPEELFAALEGVIGHDRFALCAIDCAAHDLRGKLRGATVRSLLGLDQQHHIESSYTLGIASLEEIRRKYLEQPHWSIYKVKLGTSYDIEIVETLRELTASRIRVDANCAWGVDEAITKSQQLAELGVEFIEQPLSAEASPEDHRCVFEHSKLPILADESCRVETDVDKCAGMFDGINVKLMKCGGLTPAVRMLRNARRLGLKTMVGCMVESSIGISSAAQLLPLLDFADLDGAVLLAEDVAQGVEVRDGRITMSSLPGCGCEVHLPSSSLV